MAKPSNIFMIVPAWFSNQVADEQVEQLLTATFQGVERIAKPRNQFLYLDGVERIFPIANKVLQKVSPHTMVENALENRGKGAGVLAGLKKGMENETVKWFVVRDADGDHRVEDFQGMLDVGRQIEEECGDVPILAVGGRWRLEPPLSLYRAAYEVILNECIQSALRYALARENYIPDETYFRQYRRAPDLQSGYKLYNRNAAQLAIKGLESDPDNEQNLLRWGAEIVPYVWNVKHRAIVGERLRSTYREQPVTAYGSIKRAEFYAQKLAWVFAQCELSMWNAAHILDNELTDAPLMFDAMGKTELLAFRKAVLLPLKRREADGIPPFRGGVRFL
ncbi:MAG: hypothetical protein C4527_21405 [Candidatus Omnitrophota bacterium]|jgi:hypothetical protein|nr:MAG: hypothetical protein C4527_21405 [Candidatus Omnitrophota bacterium]